MQSTPPLQRLQVDQRHRCGLMAVMPETGLISAFCLCPDVLTYIQFSSQLSLITGMERTEWVYKSCDLCWLPNFLGCFGFQQNSQFTMILLFPLCPALPHWPTLLFRCHMAPSTPPVTPYGRATGHCSPLQAILRTGAPMAGTRPHHSGPV